MKNKGMPKIIEKSKRIRVLKNIKEEFLKYCPIYTNDIGIIDFICSNAYRIRTKRIKALESSYSQLKMEYDKYRNKVESNLKGS